MWHNGVQWYHVKFYFIQILFLFFTLFYIYLSKSFYVDLNNFYFHFPQGLL